MWGWGNQKVDVSSVAAVPDVDTSNLFFLATQEATLYKKNMTFRMQNTKFEQY